MSRKDVFENSIILLGPSCVGKSLISEELSIRTQMPVFCVDDVLYFLADIQNNNLKNTTSGLARYKKLQQYFAFNFKDIKISKKDKSYVEELNKSIDSIIDQFIAYDNFLDLKRYKKFYANYCNICSELAYSGISNNFMVFLSQKFTMTILYDIINNLDVPAIIDVSAADGWYNLDYHPSANDLKILKSINFDFDIEESKLAHDEFFKKVGQKVFLHPGVDYKYRKNPYFEENNVLAKDINRYFEYADLCISVNGLFNNPDNVVFKKQRYFIDIKGNKLKERLKNKSEISNICDQILTGLSELQEYQKQ